MSGMGWIEGKEWRERGREGGREREDGIGGWVIEAPS